jgi:DNA-binding NarL/FixJ family response regulator
MQERLAAVRETAGELQRSRSELIRQLRQSMREIRMLREQLRAEKASPGRSAAPSAGARLVEQFHLTQRELEVAMLLSGGASNAAIAKMLDISQHTARHHTRHVLVKLGLHSRAQAAVLIARELGSAAAPFSAVATRRRTRTLP